MDMKISDLETCCLAYDKQFDQVKERIASDPSCATKKDRVRSMIDRSNSSIIVFVPPGWSHRSPLGVLKWCDRDRSVPSRSLPCSTRHSGRGEHSSTSSKSGRVHSLLQLGWTPLIIAVSTGHLDIVRMLLQTKKVDVEQSTSSGARPLHYACSKNLYEVTNRRKVR